MKIRFKRLRHLKQGPKGNKYFMFNNERFFEAIYIKILWLGIVIDYYKPKL
jgi:hypothetical protein